MQPIRNPSEHAATHGKSRRILCAVALALSFGGMSSPAYAEEVPPSGTPSSPELFEPTALNVRATLKRLDHDRDGSISRKEAQQMAPLLKVFRKLDANHDGSLDARELSNATVTIDQ